MKNTTPKNAQKKRAMLNRLKKQERHRIRRLAKRRVMMRRKQQLKESQG